MQPSYANLIGDAISFFQRSVASKCAQSRSPATSLDSNILLVARFLHFTGSKVPCFHIVSDLASLPSQHGTLKGFHLRSGFSQDHRQLHLDSNHVVLHLGLCVTWGLPWIIVWLTSRYFNITKTYGQTKIKFCTFFDAAYLCSQTFI